MSWICPECGNGNKDELVRCVCGYEDEEITAGEMMVSIEEVMKSDPTLVKYVAESKAGS